MIPCTAGETVKTFVKRNLKLFRVDGHYTDKSEKDNVPTDPREDRQNYMRLVARPQLVPVAFLPAEAASGDGAGVGVGGSKYGTIGRRMVFVDRVLAPLTKRQVVEAFNSLGVLHTVKVCKTTAVL